MRQIVLDTETTGLEPSQGHRIIEIGCVELVDRKLTGRHYHQYIQPQREVDQGAMEVHGITNEFLHDKPRFEDVAKDFVAFIEGAELIIHNAPFDVGFMDYEFAMTPSVTDIRTDNICSVLDSLVLARQMHPGAKNNLDALCKRYGIDNSHRTLHGALLDSEILADVYLMMTGGQKDLNLAGQHNGNGDSEAGSGRRPIDRSALNLKVIRASADELANHEARLDIVEKQSGTCLWRQ